MGKTSLIIEREYLTRVKKKSFLIMTILGPILFAAFMIVPTWLATMEDTELKEIAVVDSSKLFIDIIPESETLHFTYIENKSFDDLKKVLPHSGYYAALFIPHNILSTETAQLYAVKQPSLSTKIYISNNMEKIIKDIKLLKNNISPELLSNIKTDLKINTIRLTREGEEKESNTGVVMGVGYAAGFLIYFFIFLFGAQVMRGVIEEKTNRIVEIIVSSVRPFQLMMGKIVGIALVGLTQFILWIILTFIIITAVQYLVFPELTKTPTEQVLARDLFEGQQETLPRQTNISTDQADFMKEIVTSAKSIKLGVIMGTFIFYFLGGYLLYASLFAIIGSAVDNETDTQQFMLPVTVPLIIGIFVMIYTINNPEGPVAFWFSIIPFTSPIVMMVRIPFGVPLWEVALSMALLIITFIGTTWLAGKIYRVGILMYGKKASYKELWKWLKYPV
ncbi:MAG: ABC transporter permease [Bacteroidales bacterium]